MREIKFRAWDMFNECYWYSDKHDSIAEFFIRVQLLIDGGNEVIVEQFTTEFATDGKEIYKGDIIKFTFLGEERIEPVEYMGGSYTLGSCVSLFQTNTDTYETKKEVIGSIHQNPELLN